MEPIIRVQNGKKVIKDRCLLENINLDISKGDTVGFVGRNGSGKTVLFKCLCGFMKLSEGTIWFNGRKFSKGFDMAEDVGVIIENPGFLPEYSGWVNLKLLAQVKRRIGDKEIREAIETVGLDPNEKKPVKSYSMGMKQRLAIAQAIMEEPETLILDEPLNGLDAHGVDQMRELLLNQKKSGRTILLASHIKDDVELLCDRIYQMDGGRIINHDNPYDK